MDQHIKTFLRSIGILLLSASLAHAQILAPILYQPHNAFAPPMVQIASQGIILPQYVVYTPTYEDAMGSNPSATMSATSNKIVAIGRVYQKDLSFRNGSATKNLNHISFRTGGQTCTGACIAGTTVQVDIEAVSTSAGPPIQPDGTIAGGGTALATKLLTSITNNVWYTAMPNLTTSAVVHYGDLIAVVFSFSAYNTGTFVIDGVGAASGGANFGPNWSTFNGTTWAATAVQNPPNITLEFDDLSVGTLDFSQPYSGAATADTYNSSSNPNETGMPFQLPFNAQVDQICAVTAVANASAAGVLELTDGAGTPNVLASVTLDGHQTLGTGSAQGVGCVPIPVQSLTRNTQYYVGWKATTANNVQIPVLSFGAASSLDASMGAGQQFAYATRHGGAWSATTATQRPYMAIVVSAVPQ